MVRGAIGLQHIHLRKKKQKLESFPSKKGIKKILDNLIYFVAIAGPIMTIPQITKIWLDKTASGVSIVPWSSYFFINCFWLTYGVLHKERPIMLTAVLCMMVDVLIVIGTLLYG